MQAQNDYKCVSYFQIVNLDGLILRTRRCVTSMTQAKESGKKHLSLAKTLFQHIRQLWPPLVTRLLMTFYQAFLDHNGPGLEAFKMPRRIGTGLIEAIGLGLITGVQASLMIIQTENITLVFIILLLDFGMTSKGIIIKLVPSVSTPTLPSKVLDQVSVFLVISF